MKTWTSILAAGAILAFAAPAGLAASGSPASGASTHSIARVGIGPYAYMGGTAAVKKHVVKHSVARSGIGPYAYLGSTASVG